MTPPQPWLWGLRLAAATLGALLLWPLHNPAVALAGAAAGGALPGRLAAGLRRRRSRRLRQALALALPQLARLAAAEPVPYRVLAQAAPRLGAPLGPELERALAEHRAGVPLDEALRRLARRLDDDFYLHQLAGFTATALRQGGTLTDPLERLTARLRQAEELRAEARAELFGYGWLVAGLYAFSLAPLPLSALSGGPHLTYVTTATAGQWLLAWVVWSGLAVAALPGWLAPDE